jgi:hypothetical protein
VNIFQLQVANVNKVRLVLPENRAHPEMMATMDSLEVQELMEPVRIIESR